MTENERYVQFEFPFDDFAVKDNKTNEELWNPIVVDRLNEQDAEIKDLKCRLNSIYATLREEKCCDGDVE